MKLTCNRDDLIEGINTVQRAVASKSTNPVLEGILIEVGEEMILSGNDTELGITCEVPAIIEEIGSLVVSAKTFGDIVRKLPDTYVFLETEEDGKLINIRSGNSKSRLKIISAEGFPKVFEIESTHEIEVPCDALRDMIRQTSFAAAIGDAKPNLKGVFLEKLPGKLNMVAVDGYRLAYKYIDHEGDDKFGVIIPTRILNEVSKIISQSNESLTIRCNESSIMFSNSQMKVVSKLIRDNYIDYKNTLPKEFRCSAVVNTQELAQAAERASLIISDDKRSSLLMKIDDEGIFISSTSDSGQASEKISAEVTGSDMEIAFTPRNLMDCLKAIDAEKLSFSFSGSLGPAILKNEGDVDDFICLIMPVRMNR